MLGDMTDGSLHLPLPSMNRLNQTEPATFCNFVVFWDFFRSFYFSCIFSLTVPSLLTYFSFFRIITFWTMWLPNLPLRSSCPYISFRHLIYIFLYHRGKPHAYKLSTYQFQNIPCRWYGGIRHWVLVSFQVFSFPLLSLQ